MRRAAGQGSDLVVLPELAPSGYCFRDVAEARAASETVDGPSVAALRDVSREHSVTVVCGVALREDETLYDAAVVVEDGELLGVYRKSHLWDREKLFFTAGNEGPLVVQTRCGALAVMICYDFEFPELTRLAAQAGAEIVAVPVNWPLLDHPGDQQAIEVVKAQAVAAYYGLAVVVADRAGDERETQWVGGSCIVGPAGYLRAGPATRPGEPARECLLRADIDLAESRDKRLSRHNHRLLDRREALYRIPSR